MIIRLSWISTSPSVTVRVQYIVRRSGPKIQTYCPSLNCTRNALSSELNNSGKAVAPVSWRHSQVIVHVFSSALGLEQHWLAIAFALEAVGINSGNMPRLWLPCSRLLGVRSLYSHCHGCRSTQVVEHHLYTAYCSQKPMQRCRTWKIYRRHLTSCARLLIRRMLSLSQ
jgi:hypothetical protein